MKDLSTHAKAEPATPASLSTEKRITEYMRLTYDLSPHAVIHVIPLWHDSHGTRCRVNVRQSIDNPTMALTQSVIVRSAFVAVTADGLVEV